MALWRDRLALAAAGFCVGLAGRREGASALRDAVHLTKAGDDSGPAGRVLRQWSRVVTGPISVAGLGKAPDGHAADQIALCLGVGDGAPADRLPRVIEAVLTDTPRAETAALILAEAVLAKSLGWGDVVPLLSLGLEPHDLRRRGCMPWPQSCGRVGRRTKSHQILMRGRIARCNFELIVARAALANC